MKEVVSEAFEKQFQQKPTVIFSPGRINFIGEHTDYNMGFVMPAAIDKAIYIAISKSEDKVSRVVSLDMEESVEFSVSCIDKSEKPWANYILGVVKQLKDHGYAFGEINAVFGGDIPIGSGLSSSAALECGFGYGISQIYNLGIDRVDIAKFGQAAENQFVGMNCGIMDQFASVMGESDQCMLLDCRNLERKFFPVHSEDYSVLLCNSNVKHNLVDSEYNVRRQQCEEAVEILSSHIPGVESLRDVTLKQLNDFKEYLSEVVYTRCKYVIEENERVLNFCENLSKSDSKRLGELLFEAHDGMQNEYEISCSEIDFMVDFARKCDDVLGARMMGGGFGGCTINLVKPGTEEKFVKELNESYEKVFKKSITPYYLQVSHGTAVL